MKKQETDKVGYRDGQWKVVRLGFLIDFMKAAGVSVNQVAQLMGVSRQAVHHWFVRDDMKVSQIQRLFELCGYKIVLALEKEVAADTLPVRVTMSVVNPSGPQRLAFLKNALDRHDVSRDSLAAKLDVSKATLYNWFKSDDCFLSYVYAIALAEEMKLDICISPL